VLVSWFGQVQLMPVRQPGELGREFVALAVGGVDAHGKALLENPQDLALEPADMVDIGDDAFADLAKIGSHQRRAAWRHIQNLAGKFLLIGEHIAPKQSQIDPLELAFLARRRA
jgi:hypothetical protein